MKTYTVTIAVEITTDDDAAELEASVGALLDYGSVRDTFASADFDAAGFRVSSVVEVSES